MLEYLFELVIKNRQVVEFITTLDQYHQAAIRDFLQRAKQRGEQEEAIKQEQTQERDERERLEEDISELRALVLTK